MKNVLSFCLAVLLLSSCSSFLQENLDEKGKIAHDFEKRKAVAGNEKYFNFDGEELSGTRLQAMQFLYAYMPLPDVVDYSAKFYLQNVDYALKARSEMPWGAKVPVREFLHFVLPVRVNNENMDSSRVVFYEELKERVCGLSMHDAVLEVNHWCHEKVTYTPSDIRTSSALATVRTAHGRCGEESTFTVAALRAVGIPARQVYTPRWAHTDDNHAWVEAWVDGKWYFLGACEPEPVLNLAWFNAPASRGMLMHTKAFGSYDGPEEVLSVTPCYTEINVTSNYAPVATTNIQVVDNEGTPVPATVEFKIYNYAEFYTAATKVCDENGCASLTSGHGDMLVWASHEGMFGFSKVSAGEVDSVKIVIDKFDHSSNIALEMDITPPCERNIAPAVTEEQAAENARRFAVEDSIRNAYVATFVTREAALALAAELGYTGARAEGVVEFLRKSRGNHSAIAQFLRETAADERSVAYNLLSVVAEKDLRDVSIDVLRDHLKNTAPSAVADALHCNYVLNPRVSNEMLTPYKKFFQEKFSAEEQKSFATNPETLKRWCEENITIDGLWNPQQLCMSPRGVWDMRLCDAHSRDIFFVSAARSCGVPSRINSVTGVVQYHAAGGWNDVSFSKSAAIEGHATQQPRCMLKARFAPTTFIDNPRYYSHFTLSKIEGGRLHLQSYPENVTWASLLSEGTEIDEGAGNVYLLVTGTRMADGGVLAHLNIFALKEGVNTIDYVQRESSERLQVIGGFNSENFFYDTAAAKQRSLLSATGRGYYIIALIAPGSEPTNHFLRDVMPYKEQFEEWGQKMVLLFRDKGEAARFVNDFPQLPSTVVWGTDIGDKLYNEIVANMKLQNPARPIILVADTFNRVVFVSQGYSIGLGEQLAKVIKQLSE